MAFLHSLPKGKAVAGRQTTDRPQECPRFRSQLVFRLRTPNLLPSRFLNGSQGYFCPSTAAWYRWDIPIPIAVICPVFYHTFIESAMVFLHFAFAGLAFTLLVVRNSTSLCKIHAPMTDNPIAKILAHTLRKIGSIRNRYKKSFIVAKTLS